MKAKITETFLAKTSLIIICLAALISSCSHTKPFVDANGTTMKNSISSAEKITIGGVEQALLIRGSSKSNPILLFLHGGPGTPYDGFAYKFQAELEKRFVVVHWAQRGAGKSYNWGIPNESMNMEQLLSDAEELIDHLRLRFNKQKIYLTGHSWGAYLGMYVVKRKPDRIHAFIGAGQGVDLLEQERLSHQFVLQEARNRGDNKALKDLTKIGEPPYQNISKGLGVKYHYLAKYGGYIHGEAGQGMLFRTILKSPEYDILGFVRYGLGLMYTMKHLVKNGGDKMWRISPLNDAYQVDVPVYFIQGKYDRVAAGELLEKYYQKLEAPHKEIVLFEHSGHFIFLKEPDRFCEVIIRALDETSGTVTGVAN